MNEQNRNTLRQYFQRGDRPTESQFAQLIDSMLNKIDDDIHIDAASKFVGVGTQTPSSKLDVNGRIKCSSFTLTSNPGKGKILTSDEYGNASWKGYCIGEEHLGGIIFHLDGSRQHGLICALPSTQVSSPWNPDNDKKDVNANASHIGAGFLNSFQIIDAYSLSTGNYAALECDNLSQNNIKWYLPSLYELFLMFQNIHNTLGPGYFDDDWYFSSTQFNTNFAMAVNFDTGQQDTYNKNLSCNVRAIRAF